MNLIDIKFFVIAHRTALESIPARIWEASWQSTLLAGIILVAQWLLKKQLSARWRNALWLLVFARLLLPSLPHARFSAYHWLPWTAHEITASVAAPASPNHTGMIKSVIHDDRTMDDYLPLAGSLPLRAARVLGKSYPFHPVTLLAFLWMAGVLVAAAWSIAGYARLRRRVGRTGANASGVLREQFAAAKELLGVKRVELMVSTAVSTPFVTGFWKAKVVLPEGLETKLGSEDLRMVLLHELAHVKRGDLWMAWLSWLVATLHWFNPAIRFAMGRARKDREMACDEWVLRFISDSKGYGAALIRFLEFSQNPPQRLGLGSIGIFENKSTLIQRIRRIATYRRPTLFGSAVGIAALVAIGVFTLTAAPADAPALQLVLELSDGSRIVGTPSIDRFKLDTSYASMDIQLSKLRTVEFGDAPERAAHVSLQKGDLLNGKLGITEISMKTIFGQVVIPMAQVRRVTVEGAVQVLYDVTGSWLSEGSVDYANYQQSGKHVLYTYNNSAYDHTFEGDYTDGKTITGIQIRRNLADGTTTRMSVTITLTSPDFGKVDWTALDSNSDLVKGQTGSSTIKRVPPPKP